MKKICMLMILQLAIGSAFAQFGTTAYNVKSVDYAEDISVSGYEGLYVFVLSEVANPSALVHLYTGVNLASGDQTKMHKINESYLSVLLTAKATGTAVKASIGGTNYNLTVSNYYPNTPLRRLLGVKAE